MYTIRLSRWPTHEETRAASKQGLSFSLQQNEDESVTLTLWGDPSQYQKLIATLMMPI